MNPSATKTHISPVTVQDWEKSELRFGLEVPYRPAPHCTALSTAAPPLTEGLLAMIALWQMIAETVQYSTHHSRNHCHGVECAFQVHHCHWIIDNFEKHCRWCLLGKPSRKKSAFFLTLFKKPWTPPPPIRLNINMWWFFSEGILTKVRKCLSQQLSTK